jgi:hypothetical protein
LKPQSKPKPESKLKLESIKEFEIRKKKEIETNTKESAMNYGPKFDPRNGFWPGFRGPLMFPPRPNFHFQPNFYGGPRFFPRGRFGQPGPFGYAGSGFGRGAPQGVRPRGGNSWKSTSAKIVEINETNAKPPSCTKTNGEAKVINEEDEIKEVRPPTCTKTIGKVEVTNSIKENKIGNEALKTDKNEEVAIEATKMLIRVL